MLPDSRFLHNMGVASIVAGVILLGLAYLTRSGGAVRRATRKARRKA